MMQEIYPGIHLFMDYEFKDSLIKPPLVTLKILRQVEVLHRSGGIHPVTNGSCILIPYSLQ
jgi:hypothetical protein